MLPGPLTINRRHESECKANNNKEAELDSVVMELKVKPHRDLKQESANLRILTVI